MHSGTGAREGIALRHERGRLSVNGGRTWSVTAVVVAMALLGLAVATGTGINAIVNANERVVAARAVITPFLTLQRAVAGEAAAEASYRRAPGRAARTDMNRAMRATNDALADFHRRADGADRRTVRRLQDLNQRYVADVRDTLTPGPGRGHADHVAGPALEKMLGRLDAAVDGQRVVIDRLTIMLPAVFALAFLALAWTWRMMLLNHRRLHAETVEVRQMARTDALTGLPNRLALEDAMTDAFARRNTRAALLYLDLDRFKPVNDTHGHHAGDAVLQEVARRLTSVTRAGEVAARIGGDEFAIFLPRGLAASIVAERVARRVSEPFDVRDTQVSIGISIGIAHYPRHGSNPDALLHAADVALYQTKNAGRGGHTVYHPTAITPEPYDAPLPTPAQNTHPAHAPAAGGTSSGTAALAGRT